MPPACATWTYPACGGCSADILCAFFFPSWQLSSFAEQRFCICTICGAERRLWRGSCEMYIGRASERSLVHLLRSSCLFSCFSWYPVADFEFRMLLLAQVTHKRRVCFQEWSLALYYDAFHNSSALAHLLILARPAVLTFCSLSGSQNNSKFRYHFPLSQDIGCLLGVGMEFCW